MEDNNPRNRKRRPGLAGLAAKAARIRLYAIAAAVMLTIVSAAYLVRTCADDDVTVHVNDKIDATPTQVLKMKEIGEWEFLSIEDEEMIDTTRRRLFRNDELIRIYTGTLRLGIDLSEAKDDWVRLDGDTLRVTLPKVKLLDEDFIDEAKTQAFFESGTWSDQARDDMYHRAKAKMKARCLTKENIASAEDNALKQFFQMFKAMGYEHVEVRFDAPAKPK